MKNILVPIDFSDITEEVIGIAGQFAKTFSARLLLIHVAAPDPDFVGYDVGPQHEREWRADTLRKEHKIIQENVHALGQEGVNAHGLLVQGLALATLLKEADKIKADLIVVGSHGHGALYTLLMGTVCEGLIRKASCPVLVVPAHKGNE